MLERLWFYLIFPGIPLAVAVWTLSRMTKQRKENTRLPIKEFPRPAGWSLQQRAQDLKEDFLFNLVMLMFVGVCAALTFMFGQHLLTALIVGGFGSAYFLLRIKNDFPKVMNHNLGLLGEQATGRTLDELSSPELRVYHDYECSEGESAVWNIDHVVVASHGIYALETKTKRKKRDVNQGWKLKFDGQKLQFPDGTRTAAPLTQAANNAKYLAEKLASWNTRSYPVIPVVVYPGWYVTITGKGPVSVLNAEQLAGFFANRPPIIPLEEVRAIGNQLRENCLVRF